MDISITVPDYIYRFYADASCCISGYSPEDVMADALAAYAAMLSRDRGGSRIPPDCEQIVTVFPQP